MLARKFSVSTHKADPGEGLKGLQPPIEQHFFVILFDSS